MSTFVQELAYTPALLRALAWVSERHPGRTVRVAHVVDERGIEVTVAVVGATGYVCSPTGDVWRGGLVSGAKFSVRRTGAPLREADYDVQAETDDIYFGWGSGERP